MKISGDTIVGIVAFFVMLPGCLVFTVIMCVQTNRPLATPVEPAPIVQSVEVAEAP